MRGVFSLSPPRQGRESKVRAYKKKQSMQLNQQTLTHLQAGEIEKWQFKKANKKAENFQR